MVEIAGKLPLVSIFCMTKNCRQTIRRCVESVLNQDYSNLEFVVHDGASTDGTLEILKEYKEVNCKIKLISESDSGPAEGLFRALRRCDGDVIGSCLGDEELLPHAVSWAVHNLAKLPDVGAIYGDYYSTDVEGNIIRTNKATNPFDYARYLCHSLVPPLCSSFFRRTCLEEINFKGFPWSFDCGEFELWVRMGEKFKISYVSGLVSKFAVHPGSDTQTTSLYIRQIPGRMKVMDAFFNKSKTLPEFKVLRLKAYAGLHLWVAQTFIGLNAFPEAKEQVQKAIEYQPDSARLNFLIAQLCNHGINLLNKGDVEESLDYFDFALRANMPFQVLNCVRSIALRKLSRVDEAIAVAEAKLTVYPKHNETKQILKQLLQVKEGAHQSISEYVRQSTIKEDEMEFIVKVFSEWIAKLATTQNRLYYRDQTPESLEYLVQLVDRNKPTKIVELGTLSGLSLRTWLSVNSDVEIFAIDLSFASLRSSLEIIPMDFSRVKFIEQDILQVDFSKIWGAEDKVLLYIDAHDQPNVPIMEHMLKNAVPTLPSGCVVVVDDLWYSDELLDNESSQNFFQKVVINEIDSLQCFEGYYAPYWKGGSFFGFLEVVPLMKWVNENQIELIFKPGIKSVVFEWEQQRSGVSSFDVKGFERSCGNIKYNPVDNLLEKRNVHVQDDHGVFELCNQGAELYAADNRMDLAMACFQRASDINHLMTGVFYAQGVILARLGKFEEALQVLEKETANLSPHSNAQDLLEDVYRCVKNRQGSKNLDVNSERVEPITIFTIPKSFKGHIDVIQRNAIKSWTLLQPRPEIILFGEDEGTSEIAKEFGLNHVPDVGVNDLGTPFLNSVFELAQREASHSVVAYVNADIILVNDFISSVRRVIDKGLDRFLMVGQRWDTNVKEPIPFQKTIWEKELRQSVEGNGKLHSPTGLDYFIFKGDPWGKILPFLIGRTSWDGWLLFRALSLGVPVIDATESIFAVHQDHHYNHAKGGYSGAWNGPEAAYNKTLAQGYESVRSIVDATWSLANDELRKSSVAFTELSVNQKTPHEFAVRLCQQGKFFFEKGRFVRALSCLEEAERNGKSVPELVAAVFSAIKEIKLLESDKDETEKKVSVIIPTYNREELLIRAIRSVQSQTYPVAEIIIIDDLSTDNTASVIKKIVEGDPRIVYLRHDKNRGAQAARNTGIQRAKSEWIAFLDSDDEWLSEKLEKQFSALNCNDLSIVHCECYLQDANGTERTLFGVPPYSGNIYEKVLRHPGPMFQGLLVQKKHLEEIGLLDEGVPSYQEWDTAIRLARSYSFKFVAEPLFVYHLHAGETISKDNRREVDGWAYVVEKHRDEIIKVAGVKALARHYEVVAKKYYTLFDFPKGNLCTAEIVNIGHPGNRQIVDHIQQKRALLLFQVANQFLKDKKYSSALRLFDEVMCVSPNFNGLHYFRAVCLEKTERIEEACESAKNELRNTENHPGSLEMLNRLGCKILPNGMVNGTETNGEQTTSG